ncbi:MAG: hypothetical protein IJ202_11155 [Bacteroidales bacterium]|nr:hypothetical protein [Bacteroidales bacterium]
MEERKIPPLSMEPVTVDYPWGSETYNIADLGSVDSAVKGGWLDGNTIGEIMETYLERIVGDNVYYFYGRQFPVMVKIIRTKGRMPLTVCPDDWIASERYDALGKRKLWYIAEAQQGATVCIGLSKEMTASEFYVACNNGSIAPMLNTVVPKKGDFFMIEPGTVHCASGGLKIIEFTESSPLDFTLVKWDESGAAETDIDLAEALDFITLSPDGHRCHCHDGEECHCHEEGHECHCHDEEGECDCDKADCRISDNSDEAVFKVADEQEFIASRILLHDPICIRTEDLESFAVYTVLDGSASVQVSSDDEDGRMKIYPMLKDSSILVPSDCQEFFLVPSSEGTVLLETIVRREDVQDSYIDPSAEARLEGEDYSKDEDWEDRIDYDLEQRRLHGGFPPAN